MRSGGVVRILERPERPERRLGQLLLRSGAVTAAEVERAVAHADAEGCRIGDAFVRTVGVSPNTIARVLLHGISAQLFEHAQARPQRLHFQEGASVGNHGLPAGAAITSTLFRELRERLSRVAPNQLSLRERPNLDRTLIVPKGGNEVVRELRLTPGLAALWSLLASGANLLERVYADSPVAIPEARSAIFAWQALGCLRWAADDEARTLSAEALAQLCARVRRSHARVARARDLYEAIGLHWTATGAEIEEALDIQRKSVDTSGVVVPSAVGDMADELRRQLARIEATLVPDGSRRKYRAETAGEQIGFSAEHLFEQAKMAAFRGDLREAVLTYQRVLELVPDHLRATAALSELVAKHR